MKAGNEIECREGGREGAHCSNREGRKCFLRLLRKGGIARVPSDELSRSLRREEDGLTGRDFPEGKKRPIPKGGYLCP